jgi:monoamine oxidase
MFGAQAAQPKAEFVKDWAADPLTATAADLTGSAGHGAAPAATAASGAWRGCLAGIASEWSPRFSGYVAGAIDAATAGARQALNAVA